MQQRLIDSDVTLLELALRMARDEFGKLADEAQHPRLVRQFQDQRSEAERLRKLLEDYPAVLVEVERSEPEPDDERTREALGLSPLQRDDTPSLDTTFHDIEMDVDDADPPCSNPDGHEFACSGKAYGGDDESYHGEGRCYCIHCGADGDA